METTHDFGNYFDHQKLDKVYGEPTTKTLQKLFKQLKRNARSVTSPLGGGQYGHLFMVVTPQEWNQYPGTTPVIQPQDPGPFVLSGRVTASEIAMEQKNYDEAKKKYNRFQALKRTLRNQLVEAIDAEYLAPIRCNLTDMINQEITEIMQFLQDSYGKMTVNQIEEESQAIKNFTYDPSKSINILLTAVQEHADLLKIAGAEMSDTQIQALAYLLIGKYKIFQDALVAWNKLPNPKTWETMQTHMRTEYQMLKNVNALPIEESVQNTTDIVNELKNQQESLLTSAETRFKNGLTEVMNMAIMDLDKDKEDNGNFNENVNNASEIDNLKQEIKKLHAKLQNRGRNFTNNSNNNFFNSSRGGQSNFQSRFRNNNYPRQFYCWTHGAGHSGWNCKNPAKGHQPSATFRNRMGGNNFGCYSARPRRFDNQYRTQDTTKQGNSNENNNN